MQHGYRPAGIKTWLSSPTRRHARNDPVVEIQTLITCRQLAKFFGYMIIFLGMLITVIGTWSLIAPIMIPGVLVMAAGGILVYWETRQKVKPGGSEEESE